MGLCQRGQKQEFRVFVASKIFFVGRSVVLLEIIVNIIKLKWSKFSATEPTMKDSAVAEILMCTIIATGAIVTLTAPGWLYWLFYQAGKQTNV